ncbi:MAG TPA: hypothetical protein VGL83_06180 [Stellaceae bacterium]|jgi:hypothetical protein
MADEPKELTRAQVAEGIGFDPNTIWRWEDKGISPVTPTRDLRTGRLFYPEDSIDKFKDWLKGQRVPATSFRRKKHGDAEE